MLQAELSTTNVNAAFTRQAHHFDSDDLANPTLQQWRLQVYAHVDRFMKPGASILELNAGTGIDAVRFASRGHRVHATDLSDGMIAELKKKATNFPGKEITVEQIPFDRIADLHGSFDYVFSNFGGLNCLSDLSIAGRQLRGLLREGAHVTLVIMPRVCLWELLWIFKGQFKKAARRWSGKTTAHLEGEYFMTFYHSLKAVRNAFGKRFVLVSVEGLGVFAPPPAATHFVKVFPRLTARLRGLDQWVRTRFPFNQWGDHFIVTLKFLG